MSTTDDAYFLALLADDPEQLYERAPCGYLSTTADGTIRKLNRTFLEMTGYRAEDLVGQRRFADLLTVGGRIYHETHYAPMLHMNGTAREIALDVRHRDGRVVPVLVNAVADRNAQGTVEVIRVAVFDATHRRDYERELLRAKQQAEVSEAKAQALARTLQQTLIPPLPPVIPHLDVAAEYRPAGDGTEVGGDFFDVFQVGPDDWFVTVGDVCGKGVEAAVVTALARYTLRAAAVDHASPAACLRRVNDALLRHAADRFATIVGLRLHETDNGWSGVISAAGHPLPLLRTPSGSIRPVGRPGMLLGVVDEPRLHDAAIRLDPGDALLMYTDGLTEGRRDAEFYGDDRVREVLARPAATADELAGALLGDLLQFQRGNPRDDIAIVVVRAEEQRVSSSG
jgi:sigma-B regulation protein RsbU (phosphoserine phosphatase)